jgi:ABC-type transporter Mla maintaining outer membrane lipid asymmetry ATPase subunit MlaF
VSSAPTTPTTSGVVVRVQGLEKAFVGNRVLKGIDFTVRAGTVTVVLGPARARPPCCAR